MARVKRGVTTHARHKKVIKQAKGYQGRGRNVYRVAVERVEKALQYAYRDRRVQEAQLPGPLDPAHQRRRPRARLTYSQLMNGLKKAGVELDRKVLSDLAVREPEAFKSLVDQAQAALAADPQAELPGRRLGGPKRRA